MANYFLNCYRLALRSLGHLDTWTLGRGGVKVLTEDGSGSVDRVEGR